MMNTGQESLKEMVTYQKRLNYKSLELESTDSGEATEECKKGDTSQELTLTHTRLTEEEEPGIGGDVVNNSLLLKRQANFILRHSESITTWATNTKI